MIRYDKHFCLPAAGVSAVAIYVDAIKSLKLGDLFVFFMSGTSARLAIGAIGAIVDSQIALIAVQLLAGLVVAVVAGTVLARVAGIRRKPAVLGVRLPFPCGCGVRECQPSGSGTASAITVVMGAANTVCQRAGEVRIGVTYMTGALVKRGHRPAGALRGSSCWAWLSYLTLWSGLIAGAVAGALVYPRVGLVGVWSVAVAITVLAIYATVLGRCRTCGKTR